MGNVNSPNHDVQVPGQPLQNIIPAFISPFQFPVPFPRSISLFQFSVPFPRSISSFHFSVPFPRFISPFSFPRSNFPFHFPVPWILYWERKAHAQAETSMNLVQSARKCHLWVTPACYLFDRLEKELGITNANPWYKNIPQSN